MGIWLVNFGGISQYWVWYQVCARIYVQIVTRLRTFSQIYQNTIYQLTSHIKSCGVAAVKWLGLLINHIRQCVKWRQEGFCTFVMLSSSRISEMKAFLVWPVMSGCLQPQANTANRILFSSEQFLLSVVIIDDRRLMTADCSGVGGNLYKVWNTPTS